MPTEIGTKVVTTRFGNEDAKTLAGYEKSGGYSSLRKSLAMRPDDIVNEVKASNLRGRGGAGFSTGTKYILDITPDQVPGIIADLEKQPHPESEVV